MKQTLPLRTEMNLHNFGYHNCRGDNGDIQLLRVMFAPVLK